MILAVGVGPGAPDLLTLRARQVLEEAEVVAGFETVLRVVEGIGGGERVVLTYRNQEEQLAAVGAAHRAGRRCAACFMGDPGFSGFQLLARVARACGEHPEVVPGISSAQLAAAAAGLALDTLVLVSFHRRGPLEREKEFLAAALRMGRGAIVLPRPWDFMPRELARALGASGVDPARPVAVFESLSLADQRWEGTLAELDGDFGDLSVVVIWPEGEVGEAEAASAREELR